MKARVRARRMGRLGHLGVCLALIAVTSAAMAQSGDRRSVPAPFVCRLNPPGQLNEMVRPSALYIDRSAGEILVADSGNNRIVIFELDGTYRYEFSGGGRFSMPFDVAVDSQGYMLILGGTADGTRLFVYDFDGIYVETLDGATMGPEGDRLGVRYLALDSADRLYLFDDAQSRICVYERDGRFVSAFPVFQGSGESPLEEQFAGNMALSGDRLFVTAPMTGTVFVFDLEGGSLGTIGHQGTNVGELNFPVDVAVADNGRVYVLDRNRFNVSCYGPDGRFLGEFGGRGNSPGWFYYPTLLGADDAGHVCVGQIFQNKVQVCAVPGFILENPGQAEAGREPVEPHIPAGNPVHEDSRNIIEGGGQHIVEPESCLVSVQTSS